MAKKRVTPQKASSAKSPKNQRTPTAPKVASAAVPMAPNVPPINAVAAAGVVNAPALSASATRFAELINEHKAQAGGHFPLTDFTFFLGAGFSKSWNVAYPTGNQLFEVDHANRATLDDVEYVAMSNAAPAPAPLHMADISQIVYSLDMFSKFPIIRPRYTDEYNLSRSQNELRAFFASKLASSVGANWSWFDPGILRFQQPAAFSAAQNAIRELFDKAFDLIDGVEGHMEGARFNFITTNYDFLVEQIIDSVCGEDDSCFNYLYRGITPQSVCEQPPVVPAFDHNLVFNLLKLNGGMEVFKRPDGYDFDYRAKAPADHLDRPPVLMLPSREQNYMDDYFLAIFPKAVRLLHESRALVIVGYSMPDEDALLKFIIRQFCEDRADALKKEVFYVDTMGAALQDARLLTVFPFAGQELGVHTYSGSFSAWAAEVNQLI